MEYIKCKCNTIYVREDKHNRFEFFKTRPIRHEGERVYKCNTATRFTLDLNEIYNYAQKVKHTNGERTWLQMREFCDLVKENYFNDKPIVGNFGDEKTYYLMSKSDLVMTEANVYVADDFEEITDESAAEKRLKQKEKDKLANKKLIETFFLPNIKAILKKHGLCIHNNNFVMFESQDACKTFIMEQINKTVIKELESLGIIITPCKRWQNFNYKSTLFEINRMEVDPEKIK